MECAHQLMNAPMGHKCERLHGHTYSVEVTVRGPLHKLHHWVGDFGDIKEAIHGRFDHQYINAVLAQLGYNVDPTAEALCVVFTDLLQQSLGAHVEVVRITVQEGEGGVAEYVPCAS